LLFHGFPLLNSAQRNCHDIPRFKQAHATKYLNFCIFMEHTKNSYLAVTNIWVQHHQIYSVTILADTLLQVSIEPDAWVSWQIPKINKCSPSEPLIWLSPGGQQILYQRCENCNIIEGCQGHSFCCVMTVVKEIWLTFDGDGYRVSECVLWKLSSKIHVLVYLTPVYILEELKLEHSYNMFFDSKKCHYAFIGAYIPIVLNFAEIMTRLQFTIYFFSIK